MSKQPHPYCLFCLPNVLFGDLLLRVTRTH